MKRRCLYIDDAAWADAQAYAAAKGKTVSEYIRMAIELKLTVDGRKGPPGKKKRKRRR